MSRFAERFLDVFAGPIQLRELRATFRGWRFAVVFTTALALALFVVWVTAFMMELEHEPSSAIGQVTFLVLLTVQFGLISLLLPGFAGTSIVRERDQQTLELLSTTTIRPWQIVWGQFVAAMGYVSVYMFATLPLMAFAFWHGGLAGWEPFLAYAILLAYAALVAIWSIQVSASSASLARATIVSYLFVFSSAGPLLAALVEIIDRASRGSNNLSIILEQLAQYRLVLLVDGVYAFVAPFAFLFVVAVNRLKPPGSNRATPIRLFATVFLPSAAAVCLFNSWYFFRDAFVSERHDAVHYVWIFLAVVATSLMFQATEGPAEGKRQFRQLNALSGLKFPLRIFSPGGRRGLVFAAVLVSACVAGSGLAAMRLLGWDTADAPRAMWMMFGTVMAQAVFAGGLGMFLGGLRIPTALARAAWFLGVLAVPVASGLLMIAAFEGLPSAPILPWRVPGYLCMPWILSVVWNTNASGVAMPEVGNHVPVWVPFWVSHFGVGAALAAFGWVLELGRERENRAKILPKLDATLQPAEEAVA